MRRSTIPGSGCCWMRRTWRLEEKDPVAAIHEAAPWLKHLHLSESDRGTPGTGRVIDWTGLFAALARIEYRGGCAIESFPFADPVDGPQDAELARLRHLGRRPRARRPRLPAPCTGLHHSNRWTEDHVHEQR